MKRLILVYLVYFGHSRWSHCDNLGIVSITLEVDKAARVRRSDERVFNYKNFFDQTETGVIDRQDQSAAC